MSLLLRRGAIGRHRGAGSPTSSSGGGLLGVIPVTSVGLAASTTTTLTTASFTPTVNELLLVKAVSSEFEVTPATISGGGVTWTKRLTTTAGTGNPQVVFWTAAIGTAAAMQVSVGFVNATSGTSLGGFVVERYTGSTLATTPATVGVTGDTAPPYQATLTSTAPDSIISWLEADWNGVNGPVTYVGSPAETYRFQYASGGILSFSTAYQLAPSTGTQTLGVSTPTGQKATLGAIELVPGTPTPSPPATPTSTVVLDVSTPPVARRAHGVGAAVGTAAFTPPSGALQVALINIGWGVAPGSQPSLTVSDTSGGDWTQMGVMFTGAQQTAIFTSPVTSLSSRQVVATSSSGTNKSMQLSVQVLVGAASPVYGAKTWTSTAGMTIPVTTSTIGSMVLVAASSGSNPVLVTPSSATTSTDVWIDTTSGDAMAVGRSSATTTTPGSGNYGWSPINASLAIALEVVPGAITSGGSSTPELIAELSDNFNTGTLSALWTPNGAGVTGNQLYVNVNATAGIPVYSSARSAHGYQWSGSSLTFQVPQMPTGAGVDAAFAQFWVMDPSPGDTINRLGFEYVVATNQLEFIGQTGAAYTPIGTTESVTYSATAHQWMRIAHTGGSVVWSTSPDGVTWTVRRTLSSPPAWTTKTDLVVSFEGYRSTGGNSTVLIDNVN